ncbi:carbohydrate sulfotransferase [Skeletonema marinoi]|uniref:Carbohydrate sulfotransferase n=1 Tax=Skeletonema marinoi TaxID=267567 RepID=A0AAD9D9K5_9STRA|nr:carbohydrate sulfotransferase [Skeletonema marinoi]
MTLYRRQALTKLLLVLLFVVACLNFFIAIDSGDGVPIVLPAGRIVLKKETSPLNTNTKSVADAITIEAGHLNGNLYLPSALRTNIDNLLRANIATDDGNPWCCLIASAPNNPKRITCHGTCFLPRACTDQLYPFQSSSEQSFFHQLRNVTFDNRRGMGKFVVGSEALELQRKCRAMNARLHPPYQWCHQWLQSDIDDNQRNDNGIIDPYEANLPPAGCSLIPSTRSSYQNLLLFPSTSSSQRGDNKEGNKILDGGTTTNNKLAFCGIAKNGITNWIQLLRFIIGAPDYLSVPYQKHDWKKFQFDSLDEQVQLDILNDESYTFAAFFRDPAERLLSLYLDKINGSDERWKNHFVSRYGLNGTPSFEEFVKMIDRERTSCPFNGRNSARLGGIDWCTDEHWAPQTFNCGLSEFLPRFKFIGSLNRIEHQAKQVLQHVGLWESYGRYYHEEKTFIPHSSCVVPPPELKVGDTLSGFQQQQHRMIEKKTTRTKDQGTMKFAHHSTQSQSKLDKYYTEELQVIVKRLYANDYKVWNLIKDEEDLVSGSELAMKLSSTCNEKAIR